LPGRSRSACPTVPSLRVRHKLLQLKSSRISTSQPCRSKQAKCRCQPGGISILPGSSVLHGPGWLGSSSAGGFGELLHLSCPPSHGQATGAWLPRPCHCAGPLGWWESERRAPSCWWDRDGFQGPSWDWERKPQCSGGRQGEGPGPGLCQEESEGYHTPPAAKERARVTVSFPKYHCASTGMPLPGSGV